MGTKIRYSYPFVARSITYGMYTNGYIRCYLSASCRIDNVSCIYLYCLLHHKVHSERNKSGITEKNINTKKSRPSDLLFFIFYILSNYKFSPIITEGKIPSNRFKDIAITATALYSKGTRRGSSVSLSLVIIIFATPR